MKKLLIFFAASALLTGCVALPYDADTVYYPNTTVNATISSGYSSGIYYGHTVPTTRYVRPYTYYPAPVYVAPTPVYVRPGPVIVQPTTRFHYNREGQRPNVPSAGPRHDGGSGAYPQNTPRPQMQRRDGTDAGRSDGDRAGWKSGRQDSRGQDSRSSDSANNRQDERPRDRFRSR